MMLTEGRLNNGDPFGYARSIRLDEYRGLRTEEPDGDEKLADTTTEPPPLTPGQLAKFAGVYFLNSSFSSIPNPAPVGSVILPSLSREKGLSLRRSVIILCGLTSTIQNWSSDIVA